MVKKKKIERKEQQLSLRRHAIKKMLRFPSLFSTCIFQFYVERGAEDEKRDPREGGG